MISELEDCILTEAEIQIWNKQLFSRRPWKYRRNRSGTLGEWKS